MVFLLRVFFAIFGSTPSYLQGYFLSSSSLRLLTDSCQSILSTTFLGAPVLNFSSSRLDTYCSSSHSNFFSEAFCFLVSFDILVPMLYPLWWCPIAWFILKQNRSQRLWQQLLRVLCLAPSLLELARFGQVFSSTARWPCLWISCPWCTKAGLLGGDACAIGKLCITSLNSHFRLWDHSTIFI